MEKIVHFRRLIEESLDLNFKTENSIEIVYFKRKIITISPFSLTNKKPYSNK